MKPTKASTRALACTLTLAAVAAHAQPEDTHDQPALPGALINYAAVHNAEFDGTPEAERAWPLYAQIQGLLSPRTPELSALQGAAPGRPTWTQAETFLDSIPEFLPLARQLKTRPVLGWPWTDAAPAGWVHAVRGPEADVDEPSDNPALSDIVLPIAGTARAASVCVRLEAFRAAERGDYDEAIDILEIIPAIVGHLGETAVATTAVSAITVQTGATIEAVRLIVTEHGGSLTAEHLDRLDALLQGVTHTSLTEDLLADEANLFADTIDDVYNELDPLGNPQISFEGAGILLNLAGSAITPDLDPASDIAEDDKRIAIQNFRVATSPYEEAIEAWERAWTTTFAEAEQPVWTWQARPAYTMLKAESDSAVEDGRSLPHLLFVGGYGRIAEFCELLRMQTDAARLIVALQRYHNEHGAWPETLDAVLSPSMPEIPADWVDGNPIRYQPNEEGRPDLYSIGPDGDNDYAKPLPPGIGERYLYPPQREQFAGQIPDGDWVLWP